MSSLLPTNAILQRLCAITSDQSLDFEGKLDALLAVGSEHFGLPLAILARVEGDAYHVEAVVSQDMPLEKGTVFPLGETYCQKTLESSKPVSFTAAKGSEWATHPAYEKFKLEAYIAIPLVVAGKVFGTLNFSGLEPRAEPFTDLDYEILQLMAQWVSGELTEVQGFLDDIQARSQLIAELSRSKAEFEAMFYSIPDAVIFANVDRHIQMVNPAVQRIFGYGPEELIGRTTECLYLNPGDYHAQGEASFNPDASVPDSTFEMWYRRKSGEAFVGETSGVAVKDSSGTAYGLVAVIRDVSDRKASFEQAEHARRYFQALYDASPDMLFLHAPDGHLIDVNDHVLRLYGYTREEILGRNIQAISAEGYTQAMAEDYVRRAQAGEMLDFEWRAKGKDGHEFPIEVRLRRIEPLEDEDAPAVIAVVRDLTELRSATSELRQERDFSSTVLDTIGSVVVVMDREGSITLFNHAAQEMTGYGEAEVIGRKVWDFLLPSEQRAGVEEVFKKLVSGDFPSKYENDWLNREGERRKVFWHNAALTNDEGEVEFIIATGIDVTEQRRVEQNLARAQMEWNEVTDFLSDPIYVVDLDDTLVRGNKAFFGMIGQSPDDIVGRNITDIMHPHGEDTPCPVCAARAARKDIDIVMEVDHPDNPVGLPIQVSLRVVRDEDESPVGILMMLRDLTQQRQIEAELREHRDNLEDLVYKRTAALEAANKELEAFSYSVSHDLRAPLRAMDGFSHALLEDYGDQFDEHGKTYLERMRRASQRMGNLIDDLLLLSRVGRSAMQYMPVDLSKVARSVLKNLQETEPQREVSVDIQDDMQVVGDPRLIRQLMENLLGNAWKFSEVRDVAEISVGSFREDDGRVVFFVKDNGVGFDMRYANKLFGAFQRLHSDVEFGGTGIGLATASRIVHRHGGDIWADSELGKGAVFYFTVSEEAVADTSASN